MENLKRADGRGFHFLSQQDIALEDVEKTVSGPKEVPEAKLGSDADLLPPGGTLLKE